MHYVFLKKKILYTSNGRDQMIVWPPDFPVWGGPWPLGPPPGYATAHTLSLAYPPPLPFLPITPSSRYFITKLKCWLNQQYFFLLLSFLLFTLPRASRWISFYFFPGFFAIFIACHRKTNEKISRENRKILIVSKYLVSKMFLDK